MRKAGGTGGMPHEPAWGWWGTIYLKADQCEAKKNSLTHLNLYKQGTLVPHLPSWWGKWGKKYNSLNYEEGIMIIWLISSIVKVFFYENDHKSCQSNIMLSEEPIKVWNCASGTLKHNSHVCFSPTTYGNNMNTCLLAYLLGLDITFNYSESS